MSSDRQSARPGFESPSIEMAVEFIRNRVAQSAGPSVAVILGSGLGGLADRIENPIAVSYNEIPGFRSSSAKGHRGELIFGQFESTQVVAMAGRLHRYEGWTNDEIAFPVQLMSTLGAEKLVVSNAAGGVSPKLRVGDIMVIRDHINWMGGGFSWNRDLGAASISRQKDVYDPEMSHEAIKVATEQNFTACVGTYLATLGPTYETRSEYRMMRRIGADVAGMSTVPEVLAAAHLGMKILGLSMVSNVANPDLAIVADHSEVLEAGRAAEAKMEAIVRGVLRAS